MFVVLENLPNSSFSLRLPGFCIPLYLSTHFTTDPLFCWFTLVLLRLSVGSERGSYYQLAECSVSISFGTCFKQKTTSSSLPAFFIFWFKVIENETSVWRCGQVQYFISTRHILLHEICSRFISLARSLPTPLVLKFMTTTLCKRMAWNTKHSEGRAPETWHIIFFLLNGARRWCGARWKSIIYDINRWPHNKKQK